MTKKRHDKLLVKLGGLTSEYIELMNMLDRLESYPAHYLDRALAIQREAGEINEKIRQWEEQQ